MIEPVVGATLSEVLAQNYIREVASSAIKTVILGGVGYVSVKLVDEHILKKKK